MKRSLILAAIGVCALPAAIQAQSPSPTDRAYCARLGALYEHYLGRSSASPYNDVSRGSVEAQVAVTQCQDGNVGNAIGVLEDQLKRSGFSLPPRG